MRLSNSFEFPKSPNIALNLVGLVAGGTVGRKSTFLSFSSFQNEVRVDTTVQFAFGIYLGVPSLVFDFCKIVEHTF